MRTGRIKTAPWWDVYIYDTPEKARAYKKPRRPGKRIPAGLAPCKHRMFCATYPYAKVLALRQHRICPYIND